MIVLGLGLDHEAEVLGLGFGNVGMSNQTLQLCI